MITEDFDEGILLEIPESPKALRTLAKKLRSILFSPRGLIIHIETPVDEDDLYKPMIDAFDEAVKAIKDEEQESPYSAARQGFSTTS